jgi:hypothetical protein
MYADWPVDLLVLFTTAVLVALVVLIHYEGLALVSGWLSRVKLQHRRKVLLGVYSVIFIHIAEIWLFGVALWALLTFVPDAGSLGGTVHAQFLDSIYLSAASYTTVGFGDVTAVGAIRLISSTESLIGLILITWSASFLYLEMEQYWNRKWGGQ